MGYDAKLAREVLEIGHLQWRVSMSVRKSTSSELSHT